MTSPDGPIIRASEEVLGQDFRDFFLSQDWFSRMEAGMQAMSDLKEKLRTETDPVIISDLIVQGGAVLLGFTATTALAGAQQAELAEVARLEAEFGL